MLAAKQVGSLTRLTRVRALQTTARRMDDESVRLRELYAKFQDPTSHYHIPPGTNGPEHEDDHTSSRDPSHVESEFSEPAIDPSLFSARTAHKLGLASSSSPAALVGASAGGTRAWTPREKPSSARLGVPDTRPSIQWSEPSPDPTSGRSTPLDRPWLEEGSGRKQRAVQYFKENGYDTAGVLTWPVAWGDCDMFQHVNNVRILRWLETARVRYWESWAGEMPEGALQDVMRGRGTGMILKDISIKYKAPITYPDTVMVTNRIHSIKQERASFGLSHLIWSLKDDRVVAEGDSTLVMYDYERLKKGVMSDRFREMLEGVVESYGEGSA
ncbi:hypothetical protein I317_07296 [Kwoniella heveanensis CBS 569]|uniref:Thioesterase n=1 Tax=Kwoniella heveanensis BCC8398 TaxID=1296120 RepID=A0A1B9GV02_9TREE|nr:hypothetical protein I316_03410 [Kwoniella heveanensis BCC8398]OCF38918.1 hypothetical protein I317_07296 [Kwoniella heveanensis CBS 569]